MKNDLIDILEEILYWKTCDYQLAFKKFADKTYQGYDVLQILFKLNQEQQKQILQFLKEGSVK